MHIQRRSFIKYASLAAAGNIAGMRPFGALNALAATTPDYKALVCIFLFGGNDANNMVVPFDTKGYANYSTIRAGLALPQSSLLPLTPLPNFALHPSLPDVQSLFNSGHAAIVANVGQRPVRSILQVRLFLRTSSRTRTSRRNGRTRLHRQRRLPDGLAESLTHLPAPTMHLPPSRW
jgi:uncharacterized protein (DUF1501 family)